MLWNKIKQKMMEHPQARVYEKNVFLTYEEIVVFVENFAKKLTQPCYGIYCKSEMMSAIALLSCFAARKTAVPISYRYGELFCKRIMEFIQPQFMIDDYDDELNVVEIVNQKYEEPEQDIALIMSTSGTSGFPKGVMLSEENIWSNVQGIMGYFKLTASDKILISRSLHHCAVITGELLVALLNGAEIHFIGNPYNVVEYIHEIDNNQITVACATPTYFNMLRKCSKRNFNTKKVSISGECLTSGVAKEIRKLFPKAKIYNVYGLTEASPRVAYLTADQYDEHPGCINEFLPGETYAIVDSQENSVPDNIPGELLIKGDNIMVGYYKNEVLTKQKMKNGWLHTGDIVIRQDNGFIKIMGRKDDMIVHAGMNIYPSEIENAMKKDPRVEEIVAYGISDLYCGQVVGVKVKGNFSSVEEVQEIAKKYLPLYEIPKHIEIVKEIEKNATGKVVRRHKND